MFLVGEMNMKDRVLVVLDMFVVGGGIIFCMFLEVIYVKLQQLLMKQLELLPALLILLILILKLKENLVAVQLLIDDALLPLVL